MFQKLRPLSLNFSRVSSVFKKSTGQVRLHGVRQVDKENPIPNVDHNTLAGGMGTARTAKTAKERKELERMVLQNQMHSSVQYILGKM